MRLVVSGGRDISPEVPNVWSAVEFPGGPWLHFSNGYFELRLFFLVIEIMFC